METGNISQQRRKRDRWLESWAPEIVASLISLASVAAIFGCLLAWQGEPIFEWHRVTPNTVVAILATVARIFNGISVSSALGQFKWIWHHQKARPLHDFALIIGATTGPWDSLKLLVRTRSLYTSPNVLQPHFLTRQINHGSRLLDHSARPDI